MIFIPEQRLEEVVQFVPEGGMGAEGLGGAEQQQVVKAERKMRGFGGSKPTERLWTARWECQPRDKGKRGENREGHLGWPQISSQCCFP